MRLRSIVRRTLDSLVPRRYWLAYDLTMDRWLGRLACEEELFILDRIPGSRRIAIDAGANKGLYTTVLARLFEKVVAFEPNPVVTRKLRECCPSNVEVRHLALGSSRSTARLHIPIVEGQELDGWASFDEGNRPGSTEFRTLEVETVPLDDLDLEDVSFIKIDVEGHEREVLMGATGTIERWRPAVLAEVKVRSRPAVAEFFAARAYRSCIWEDGVLRDLSEGLARYEGPKENFFFLPSPDQGPIGSRGPGGP